MLPDLDDWGDDSVAYREGEGNGIGLMAVILFVGILLMVMALLSKGCA